MINNLEATIEHAQKITLGQLDNGTLATAVTCADTLAIARHGRVESYVIPKHLIDEQLLKMAVLECDNKRLLGERVAASIEVPKSHFFNHAGEFPNPKKFKKMVESINNASEKIRRVKFSGLEQGDLGFAIYKGNVACKYKA